MLFPDRAVAFVIIVAVLLDVDTEASLHGSHGTGTVLAWVPQNVFQLVAPLSGNMSAIMLK